jgi:hypothetical protein
MTCALGFALRLTATSARREVRPLVLGTCGAGVARAPETGEAWSNGDESARRLGRESR